MKKTIKVEYSEQSKAVVVTTKLEVEAETLEESLKLDKDLILKEAIELYSKASEFSDARTRKKALQQ